MERYREAAARVLNSRFLPFVLLLQKRQAAMNLFELTRALVDIDPPKNHKNPGGDSFSAHLPPIPAPHNGKIERPPVKQNRDTFFACGGEPIIPFSTQMDPVPPFFASQED